MAAYGCIWLRMVVSGCIVDDGSMWLKIEIYGNIMVFYGSIRPYMVIYVPVYGCIWPMWLYIAEYGYIMATYYMAVYGDVWLYMVIYGYIRQACINYIFGLLESVQDPSKARRKIVYNEILRPLQS